MRELNYYIRQDLTVCPMYAGRPMWIATAAMLAASVASALIGGSKAKKAAKKAAQENAYRTNAEKAWYEKEYNTDYLDTKAGQNLLRKAQETQDKYIKKAQSAAAVTGGTDASVAMAKEQANKVVGDTIADIGAQDTKRKQQVADQHRQNVNQLSQERQQIEQSKAEATTQAAQNMSNAFASAAMSRMGSQSNGVKAQDTNNIGKTPSLSDNTMITQNHVLDENNVPSLDKAIGIAKSKERYL